MSDILRELAEPSRRAILTQLKAGPRNVSELVDATGMKQPNVSNHLSKLRARGIVRANKVGREVFYSLASAEVEAAVRGLLESGTDETEPDIRVEDATRQYAKAAVAGDEQTCGRIVDNLIRQGVPLVRIYQHVIAAAMDLVGKWYSVEAIDEGQEHLASAITERMMARVLHFSAPTKKTSRVALLGCVSGNWHSIGLRMISDYLRLTGWRTLYLGANVPQTSFMSAVHEHEPDMVLISCAREDNETDCLALIQTLKRSSRTGRSFRIGVGGAWVTQNPRPFLEAGADFSAINLMEFAEEVMPRLDGVIEEESRAPNAAPAGNGAAGGRADRHSGPIEDHANGHSNGHSNGHAGGHTDGHPNGHANGHPEGQVHGHANGHADGRANGHANDHANGHAHGHADPSEHRAEAPRPAPEEPLD